MKKLLLILAIAIASVSVQAQDATGLVNALKAGSADQVSNYFDRIIDLKFPDKEEIKSIGRNQAGIALKSFFDDNKITGFELSSQREISGTMYIAGKLTNGNEGYKLSMMLKYKEGKPQIITVRIM
jgi:opacity protein-like surface antigen